MKYSYEEAVRIRKEQIELQEQIKDIIVTARLNKSAVQIARDLQLTESYVHRILRESKKG